MIPLKRTNDGAGDLVPQTFAHQLAVRLLALLIGWRLAEEAKKIGKLGAEIMATAWAPADQLPKISTPRQRRRVRDALTAAATVVDQAPADFVDDEPEAEWRPCGARFLDESGEWHRCTYAVRDADPYPVRIGHRHLFGVGTWERAATYEARTLGQVHEHQHAEVDEVDEP